MNDIDGIKLVNAIRRIVYKQEPNNMIFGKVVSVSPLKIDIGNNVILTRRFLYLGQMCRPFKVTIPHTHKYNGETKYASATSLATDPTTTERGDLSFAGSGSLAEIKGHYHKISNQVTEDVHGNGGDYDKSVTIEIYPKLKEGDVVLMFAMNSNQMYYVAERVEK